MNFEKFIKWSTIAKMNIENIAGHILTNVKIGDFGGDDRFYHQIVPQTGSLSILDFGCGIGRNTYALSVWSSTWKILGYDSKEMISHTEEYRKFKYKERQFPSVEFNENWDDVKSKKFDYIYSSLVLQHICRDDLIQYIRDFKKMSKELMIVGRRYNDESQSISNWSILEQEGLIPYKFCQRNEEIPYTPEGNPHDHNEAYYKLQ